ncbi:hypothetical protein NDU88_006204 [Pleurodeles waltl]|uniref:Uncharacterized protein n=1 Tax=Pleurodeles waltl TaxID=8319 RepID=A0AAV7VQQ7_PLEWA|nr:hypothetical protein NDU88_006204 [Pleurodeles waltl]
MCAPQSVRPEAVWRTTGAVWWHRAALELRRTRKSVARIPIRGNSGSGSCRTGGAATKKLRLGEQPKENPEKGVRKKTVRVAMEVTTRQVENGTGEGKEGTRSPPLRPGEEQTAPVLVQTPNENPSEVQDFAPKLAVLEPPQAASVISPLLSSSLEVLILSISEDVKKGFANSEVNQGEIREVCANLEKKIDGVMVRTQALEEAMGGMKEELVQHKGEIDTLKRSEQALKNRVEQMENYSRRNNLKLLKAPEGAEGSDLKAFVVSLIKSAVDLEETEDEIGKDIQRIHRDPFKLRSNSSRPRKIFFDKLFVVPDEGKDFI